MSYPHDPQPPKPVDLESKFNALSVEERPQDEEELSGIPILELPGIYIDDLTISRLAMTLLGHVLYLKNQIPFPVAQLAKIYARENASESQIERQHSKAAKLRNEFLDSFDVLSSHLDTTFSSISDALAKANDPKKPETSTVFVMIILGPSITTPRARVIMGVEGLRVKLWGVPEDDSDLDADSSGECESEDEDGHETKDKSVPEAPVQSSDAARLLSRLLSVTPDALSLTELSPTQVHILIRAPRRFSHPSWIAKQQLNKTLDKVLDAFKSGENTKKIEGIRIKAKDLIREGVAGEAEYKRESTEEDELIWWSWDGKLAGFSG